MTASTTILEKNSFWPAISLEFRAVAAHFSNSSLCSLAQWSRKEVVSCTAHRRNIKSCSSQTENSLLIVFFHRDGDLLYLADGEIGGGAECSDDGLRVETLLHVWLQLLQELCSQEGDGGGAVPNLRTKTVSIWNSWQHKLWCTNGLKQLTSASWERAMSTRVLAAGWTTSSSFRMVAPSLEIVAFPGKINICITPTVPQTNPGTITPFFPHPSHLCCPPSVCPSLWAPGWSWQPQKSPAEGNTSSTFRGIQECLVKFRANEK